MPGAWPFCFAMARFRKGGIPPSELPDQRELLRRRIFLVHLRTRVKNRIHGTLARHDVQITGADLFGVAARLRLGARLPDLPVHSREALEQELATLDFLEMQIESAEGGWKRSEGERGGGSAEDAAARAFQRRSHTYGQVCRNVNRNLKRAFVETGIWL